MKTTRRDAAAGLALALGLAAARAAAGPCDALPTSAQRPGQVSCNPRQRCMDGITVHGPARTAAETACNALPTNGTCPGNVTFNPREECLAKQPKPPELAVSSVDNAESGYGATVNLGRENTRTLIARGKNLGLPGNSVTGEGGGFSIGTSVRAGCLPPNCLALQVVPEKLPYASVCGTHGDRSFVVRDATRQSEARGAFRLVPIVGWRPVPRDLPQARGAEDGTLMIELESKSMYATQTTHGNKVYLRNLGNYKSGSKNQYVVLWTNNPLVRVPQTLTFLDTDIGQARTFEITVMGPGDGACEKAVDGVVEIYARFGTKLIDNRTAVAPLAVSP